MASYEQALRLFERWCAEELRISTVDKVTEPVIRKYINDLQERGKYTFYVNDQSKKKNYPERRRDYRKPVSVATINNYIRNLRVFFNWLERDYPQLRTAFYGYYNRSIIILREPIPYLLPLFGYTQKEDTQGSFQ